MWSWPLFSEMLNMRIDDKDDDALFELPINGILDLHTFMASECKSLIPEFLLECRNKNILQVRIIHGKGRGVLRETVRCILQREPSVLKQYPAGEDAGGWGATIVLLKPPGSPR